MYRSLLARDVWSELERLQRSLGAVLEPSPGIRGGSRGGYPALNVGSSAEAVEVYAFAPGLDPATLQVTLDRGVLSLAGERAATLPEPGSGQATLHQAERFTGTFRRVVSLPDDIDPNAVRASYREGLLHVRIPRKAAPAARRIEVQ